jgi:hypothetical protein
MSEPTVVKNTFQCSCEITKNSKGYGWVVKAVDDDASCAVMSALEANEMLISELEAGDE